MGQVSVLVLSSEQHECEELRACVILSADALNQQNEIAQATVEKLLKIAVEAEPDAYRITLLRLEDGVAVEEQSWCRQHLGETPQLMSLDLSSKLRFFSYGPDRVAAPLFTL